MGGGEGPIYRARGEGVRNVKGSGVYQLADFSMPREGEDSSIIW